MKTKFQTMQQKKASATSLAARLNDAASPSARNDASPPLSYWGGPMDDRQEAERTSYRQADVNRGGSWGYGA